MLALQWHKKYSPGILFVFIIALAAELLGKMLPLISGPIFGIIIGICINNIWGKPIKLVSGIIFCSKKILQWAIIVLGCGLSLSTVWHTGKESAIIMIISLVITLIAAYAFGKLLKIPERMAALIGVGTGICGGSAIAAISPIIEADDVEIAYSISTIFLFNLIAVFILPTIGQIIGMSDETFGLWAGSAINDTSSVVVTGYIFSQAAGDYATVVKLVRTTMIIPIALLAVAIIGTRKKLQQVNDQTSDFKIITIIPWFIVWFLVASLFNTLGFFSDTALHFLKISAKFMIVMALTAVGLSADFRKMFKSGIKPILFGLILWITILLVSLLLIRIMNGHI